LDQEHWLKVNCPGLYIQNLLDEKGVTLDDLILSLNDRTISKNVDLTLVAAGVEFLEQEIFETDSTEKQKTHRIDLVVDGLGRTKSVSEISTRDLNIWQKSLKSKYAPSTRHTYMRVAKELFAYLSNTYGIDNPCDNAKAVSVPVKVHSSIPTKLLMDTINNVDPGSYEILAEEYPKFAFTEENARKDQIFWTLLAFTGASPIDACNITPSDFEGISQRQKSNIRVKYVLVDQLAKFGGDLFNIFTGRGQYSNSGKRFKVLTGFTFKAIRRFFLNELESKLARRDLKALAGHSEKSNVLDTNYLNADESAMEKGVRDLANEVMPIA